MALLNLNNFSLFCILFIFGVQAISNQQPSQIIPDLSPYGIGISIASVIPLTNTEKDDQQKSGGGGNNGNNDCIQKIASDIHQHMDNIGINIKNFSSIVKDERKFNKMCSEYLTLKQSFNSDCPKPIGFIYKNGIITFLEIICRIKKDSIIANRECISEMEISAFPSCQQACISQNYKGFDALADAKNIELRCFVSSCISRCINDQIRECGESKALAQLFNEISGAQMLLGIEQIYAAGSKQTSKFVQSDKVPASCRRLIWRSVLAASNLNSRRTTTASSSSDSISSNKSF